MKERSYYGFSRVAQIPKTESGLKTIAAVSHRRAGCMDFNLRQTDDPGSGEFLGQLM
jgi:hypothetical protein